MPYVKLVGRLGAPVGTLTNEGTTAVWCDAGTVTLVPLLPSAKVDDEHGPWSAGEARMDLAVDPIGRLTRDGQPFASVLDLTADDVNPRIGPGMATHRVQYGADVAAGGVRVRFPWIHVRIAADTVDPETGECDLTKLAPVPVAGGVPMHVGEAGASVASADVDEDGRLVLGLTDGTSLEPVPLPLLAQLIPDPDHPGFYKIGA